MKVRDSICALASGQGRAGVAVLRLSGPDAGAAVIDLCGGLPEARRASLRTLRDPISGEALDRALVLWFPGPDSFTGEDVAEFHLHGGPAVVRAVLAALCARTGCRPAEAGEFTRRAYLAGKLDLTEVEGLADLVAAETEAQRRQALRQMEGAFGQRIEAWRGRLIRNLAHLEATIDFSEEDLPPGLETQLLADIGDLAQEIKATLTEAEQGINLRDGFRIAILGAPNAGKSSLLNALAARDVAIVSEVAGTTRDVIEVHLELAGQSVILVDTAGLREATDGIEREGIKRALAQAGTADLRLALVDGTEINGSDEVLNLLQPGDLTLVSKADLRRAGSSGPAGALTISARTGEGMSNLIRALEKVVRSRAGLTENAGITRDRHRLALEEVAQALGSALAAFEDGAGTELVAENLRLATRALGRLTGRVGVEDLLDVIFREFCIGK